MDIWTDIKQTFRHGSVLTRLIYVNLGVFLTVKLIGLVFFLGGLSSPLIQWLSVPSDLEMLVRRLWTPLTYMFLHEGFLHLLFNILGLYWFGKLFLYHFEGEKLLSVYIMGGLAGALLYILAFNIFPAFTNMDGLMLGASAAVFAILMAIAIYDPNREIRLFFIGSFPLKYISAFYVVLSIISISAANPGGNIAHLGGALWGWFYIAQLRRGKDRGSAVNKGIIQLEKLFKPKEKMKVTFKQPPRDDYEYKRQQNYQQEEINRILDKIAESGYESLTKQEKEVLFKQGK
jgi:membrane associated rhomboid family serine protease